MVFSRIHVGGVHFIAQIDGLGSINADYFRTLEKSEIDMVVSSGNILLHLDPDSFDGVWSIQGGSTEYQSENDEFSASEVDGGFEGTNGNGNGGDDVFLYSKSGAVAIQFTNSPKTTTTTTTSTTTTTTTQPDPNCTDELSETDFKCSLTNNVWTVPVTWKVTKSDEAPSSSCSRLHISGARREFEPFQLVHKPSSGSATVSFDGFSGLSGARIEFAKATYTGDICKDLMPFSNGDSISLSSSNPTAIWITVFIPESATAGNYDGSVQFGNNQINVRLRVFDFTLPKSATFRTQHNIGINNPDPTSFKTLLFEHRFSTKSNTWPSGFKPQITWDSDKNPNRCSSFYDEQDEGDQFAIHALAKKFMRGEGWTSELGLTEDVGFSSNMLFQFINNQTPRPDTFCGENRGSSHFGTDAYNEQWSNYLTALTQYLKENNLLDGSYYYVQNEPQNQQDYDVAAFLCQLTKQAAPDLSIAISEEAKAEIAQHQEYNCPGYDIWIAHLPAYKRTYAWERLRDHGEESWFYSLPQDAAPYPNPTVASNQGMHSRILTWIAWTERIRGYAYYNSKIFFNANDARLPAIEASLMRESYEDYEYFYLANQGKHPEPFKTHPIDEAVSAVAPSLASWMESGEALMALKHEIGRYIEGSRTCTPKLSLSCSGFPRDSYYLNFQDAQGSPSGAVTIDNNDAMKIDIIQYDEEKGYGFTGANSDNGQWLTGYATQSTAGSIDNFSEAQRSYVYDNFGKVFNFLFDIENGSYTVTVGIGTPRKGYPGDPHNVKVEGAFLFEEYITSDAQPVAEKTMTVNIQDCRLTLVLGGRSTTTNADAFTFLSYVKIVPV